MKKRIILMLLALSLCIVCFAGCGAEPTAETTEAPTTEAPTTEEPTTEAPTTEAPTTEEPTTEEPTTEVPSTPFLTAEEYYEKAKESFAARGVNDLSPLTTEDDGGRKFTYLDGAFEVSLYADEDGYIVDLMVWALDDALFEEADAAGDEAVLALLAQMSNGVVMVDDSLDAETLVDEFFKVDWMEANSYYYRAVMRDGWLFALVTPYSEDFLTIVVQYQGD